MKIFWNSTLNIIKNHYKFLFLIFVFFITVFSFIVGQISVLIIMENKLIAEPIKKNELTQFKISYNIELDEGINNNINTLSKKTTNYFLNYWNDQIETFNGDYNENTEKFKLNDGDLNTFKHMLNISMGNINNIYKLKNDNDYSEVINKYKKQIIALQYENSTTLGNVFMLPLFNYFKNNYFKDLKYNFQFFTFNVESNIKKINPRLIISNFNNSSNDITKPFKSYQSESMFYTSHRFADDFKDLKKLQITSEILGDEPIEVQFNGQGIDWYPSYLRERPNYAPIYIDAMDFYVKHLNENPEIPAFLYDSKSVEIPQFTIKLPIYKLTKLNDFKWMNRFNSDFKTTDFFKNDDGVFNILLDSKSDYDSYVITFGIFMGIVLFSVIMGMFLIVFMSYFIAREFVNINRLQIQQLNAMGYNNKILIISNVFPIILLMFIVYVCVIFISQLVQIIYNGILSNVFDLVFKISEYNFLNAIFNGIFILLFIILFYFLNLLALKPKSANIRTKKISVKNKKVFSMYKFMFKRQMVYTGVLSVFMLLCMTFINAKFIYDSSVERSSHLMSESFNNDNFVTYSQNPFSIKDDNVELNTIYSEQKINVKNEVNISSEVDLKNKIWKITSESDLEKPLIGQYIKFSNVKKIIVDYDAVMKLGIENIDYKGSIIPLNSFEILQKKLNKLKNMFWIADNKYNLQNSIISYKQIYGSSNYDLAVQYDSQIEGKDSKVQIIDSGFQNKIWDNLKVEKISVNSIKKEMKLDSKDEFYFENKKNITVFDVAVNNTLHKKIGDIIKIDVPLFANNKDNVFRIYAKVYSIEDKLLDENRVYMKKDGFIESLVDEINNGKFIQKNLVDDINDLLTKFNFKDYINTIYSNNAKPFITRDITLTDNISDMNSVDFILLGDINRELLKTYSDLLQKFSLIFIIITFIIEITFSYIIWSHNTKSIKMFRMMGYSKKELFITIFIPFIISVLVGFGFSLLTNFGMINMMSGAFMKAFKLKLVYFASSYSILMNTVAPTVLLGLNLLIPLAIINKSNYK